MGSPEEIVQKLYHKNDKDMEPVFQGNDQRHGKTIWMTPIFSKKQEDVS